MNFTEDEVRLVTRIYKDNECPICHIRFNSIHQLAVHVYSKHKKENLWAENYRKQYENYNKDYLICPYCNKKFNDLVRHLKREHNISRKEFRLKFPLIPLKLIKTKNGKFECQKCNKIYKRNNDLSNHYRLQHPEIYREIKNKRLKVENEKKFICPICYKKINSIRQHVQEGHNIKWEDFCKKYKWNIKDSKYISDEYRRNLSINKKQFYNSKKGMDLREEQSKRLKINNPSKNPKIAKTISEKAIKNINKNPFFNYSWGIRIKDDLITDNKYVRSFEEFKVLYFLKKNNINFEYEKEQIKCIVDNKVKNYLPDLKINNIFYEIKSNIERINREVLKKYNSIKDKEIHIVTFEQLMKLFNIKYDIQELINYCSNKIKNNEMKIICRTYKRNSRILKSICANYKTNENIDFKSLGE